MVRLIRDTCVVFLSFGDGAGTQQPFFDGAERELLRLQTHKESSYRRRHAAQDEGEITTRVCKKLATLLPNVAVRARHEQQKQPEYNFW